MASYASYEVEVTDGRLRVKVLLPVAADDLYYDIESPVIAAGLETIIERGEVSPQEIAEYADRFGLTGLYEAVGGLFVDRLQTLIESASEPYGLGPVSGEEVS